MQDPLRGYSLTSLKRFEFPLLDEDIAKVEVSPSCERISCLATDGGLWTLDCPTGESTLQFSHVADFSWQLNTTSDTLILVKSVGADIFSTHQFASKFVTTNTTFTSDSVLHGSARNHQVIHCCEKLLVTLADRNKVVCQRISSIILYVQWTQSLSDEVVAYHTLNEKYIFLLTTAKEIVCFEIHEGTQVALWRLAELIKDDPIDFMFTADLNKLYVTTGTKVLEIECQGESWYNFSCLLGGSRYRNYRRVRKVKKILNFDNPICMGMYRGKNIICAGEKLVLFDKVPIEFGEKIIFISNVTRMESKIPKFLQKDQIKVLYHGITVRSILQQVLEGKGSSTAEQICKLNNWSNISMDLTVLQQGIINEHSDMIQFFFKMKLELSQSVIRSSVTHEKLRDEFSSWQAVTQEVKRKLQDGSRRDFSERLMKIMVSSIAQLLHWITSVTTESPIQEEFVSFLCSKMSIFRNYLCQMSTSESEGADCPDHALNSLWEQKSEEEVIHDALQNGTLNEAQLYLRRRRDDKDLQDKASQIGKELVLDYLLRRETAEAYKLMESLGWDIDEKLKFFFLHAKRQEDRITILQDIMQRPSFTEDLKSLLGKMEIYLRHYSCQGAKGVLDLSTCHEASAATGSLLNGPNVNLIEHHMIMGTEKCPGRKYTGMVLVWLMKWDNETFNNVILHSGSAKEEMKEMNPNVVWKHFLKYAKMHELEQIVNSIAESTGEVFSEALPNLLEINSDMLDDLEGDDILPDVAETVRLQMARKNLVSDIIVEDFPRLLNTLGRIKVSVYDLFDIEVFLEKHDYVHRMIHFCLANDYLHFLHEFLLRVEIHPSCSQCMSPLLTGLIQYNQWVKNPSKILDVALAFSKETYNTDDVGDLWSDHKLKLASILSMLTKAWDVPPHVLKKLPPPLAGYIREQEGVLRDDISMYQLLSKSTVFDMSKMFGFQRRNSLYEGENASLPYFSESSLVEVHGLKEPLTYVYYLLKYRPGCALECFFKDYKASPRILKAAAKQVVRIALNMFTNEKFVACCIAFIEGIDQDSSNLRLLVEIGRRLLPRYAKQDLVENLCHVYFDSNATLTASQNAAYKETAQVISQDLVNLLREEFAEDRERIPLLKPSSIVLLQHDFCSVYQLEMPCTILELCTETDNWLAFIVWAQVLQISRSKIMPTLKGFSNQIYREHLEKALSQVSSLKDMNIKSSVGSVKRDTRAPFYYRLGVVKHQQVIENYNYSPPNSKRESNSDPDSFSCTSDESSQTINTSNTQGSGGSRSYPSNLIDLVVHCHHSAFPVNELLSAALYHWNPAPALIATHYNENIEQCFAVWLETTTIMSHTRNSQAEKGLNGLMECVENALKLRCLSSLKLGYSIFLPDSAVLPLVQYAHGFLVDKNYFAGEDHWKSFVERFSKDRTEIEYVSKILIYSILICDSVYEQRLLLRKFKSLHLDLNPDFGFMAQIIESVADADWHLPFEHLLLSSDSEVVERVLRKEASNLIEKQLYELAIKFSRAARISLDDVICELLNHQLESKTSRPLFQRMQSYPGDYEASMDSNSNTIIEQVAEARTRQLLRRDLSMSLRSNNSLIEESYEQPHALRRMESVGSCASAARKISVLSAQKSVDNSELKEKSFWERAHTLFRKYNVTPATCFMFFKKKSEQVESDRDKFIAMKYALRWNDSERHRITFWLYLLRCIEYGDLEILSELDCEAEELTLLQNQEIPETRMSVESSTQRTALKQLINNLLSRVAFRQAQFVATVFSTETEEYQLAVTCVQLAEGFVLKDSIPTYLKDYLEANQTERRVRLSKSVKSESCNTIEQLSLAAQSSQAICRRVFILNLLSTTLGLEYSFLAKVSDPLQLLRRILTASLSNKFQLAKELISVYSIEDAVLSSYIYREVQKALELKDEEFDMLGNFEQVVSLCKDPTSIGNRILYGLKKDEDIHLQTDKQIVLYNEVELCILAHDSFTVACCMEGITHVLRHCHCLVQWLIRYEKFAMMIRLLTGIGRYSEMSFIFDALEEYDHFEMLFQRGMEKVPHLKVALLDYLKKKKELRNLDTMFKLNFRMHREIAEMLSESADERLMECASTEDSSWPDNADLRQISATLDTVIVDLADAAESFVKADCLLHALDCTRRAEFLSLQMYYIQNNSKTKIINLSQDAFTRWINKHPVFSEARLVSEVSPYSVSWHNPLFFNIIVNGNQMYLKEFQSRMPFTSDLLQKITECYSNYERPSPSMQLAMEKLIEEFPDLETKYYCAKKIGSKLATKLKSSNDVLNDLLNRIGR